VSLDNSLLLLFFLLGLIGTFASDVDLFPFMLGVVAMGLILRPRLMQPDVNDVNDLNNAVEQSSAAVLDSNSLSQSAVSLEPSDERELLAQNQEIQELQTENQQLWTVLDSLPQFIFWKDAQGRYQGCNQKFAYLVGMEPTEIQHKTDSELPWTRSMITFNSSHDQLAQKENLPTMIESFPLLEGGMRLLEVYKGPLGNFQGNQTESLGIVGCLTDVTKRNLAEKELEESELRLRTLADASFEGLFIHYRSKIIDVNATFAQILGYQDSEIVNKPTLSLVAPESEATVRHCLTWATPRLYSVTLINAYGMRIPVEIRSRPIQYQGRSARVVAVRNISARLAIESARWQAEEKYQRIFEHSGQGIFQTTPQGSYITVNPKFAQILGYSSPEEMLSAFSNQVGRTSSPSLYSLEQGDRAHQTHDLPELSTPFYLPQPEKLYVQPQNHPYIGNYPQDTDLKAKDHNSLSSSVSVESEVYRKDGSKIWIYERIRPIYDTMGNVMYYEGTAEDITVRKQTELALLSANAYLNAIIDNLGEGLLVINFNGIIGRINPVLTELLQISSDQLLDHNYRQVLPAELITITDDAMAVSTEVLQAELPLPDDRTGMVVATTINRSKVSSENYDTGETICIGVVILIADITAAKELDRMKTGFITNISHELRTPLTSILGFTRVVEKKLEENIFPHLPNTEVQEPKLKRAVSQIKQNLQILVSDAQRLTNIINNVLDIADMESGHAIWEKEPVNMSELLNQVAKEYQDLMEIKGISLNCAVRDDLPIVLGSRERLRQVFTNLLSNALKFTPSGSVTLSASFNSTTLHIALKDTGIGIARQNQESIFMKFKQIGDIMTDKPQGTGLGLPLCKEIIARHHGKIWLESALDEGTTFFVELPISN
jgi:PAS domain S-box-containing protein